MDAAEAFAKVAVGNATALGKLADPDFMRGEIAYQVQKAIDEEREACAKMIENAPMGKVAGGHHTFAELVELADAIRKRKD